MGRMKQPTINSSRFKVRDVAKEQAFDPKKSRANKLLSREDAFGGDEDECEYAIGTRKQWLMIFFQFIAIEIQFCLKWMVKKLGEVSSSYQP